jgi:nanoRNase/pAp phosphatase (c-di-AMP/oligoRNAs hydrolase)
MLPAATRYGGGGHKNACGATIPLDLDAAIREFIPWAVDCVKNTL